MDVVVAPTRTGLLVTDPSAGTTDDRRVPWAEVPAWVRERERDATAPVRWVWPDTASLYPHLLAAGVRVGRCQDLRLCHTILALATPDSTAAPSWLAPLPAEPTTPSLLDDLTPDHAPTVAEVAAEHRRQLAALDQAADPGRLRLLLAAESAGALIAAEMHADGLPWDRARHDQILSAALGPRPPAGMRPERLEELAVQIRELLHAPGLNPDSQAALLRSLRNAGLEVTSTAKWELGGVTHPVIEPLLEYKRLARLLSANGWGWLERWVRPGQDGRSGRFRTDYVPGGVVTGRWATSGGGALQIPRAVRAAVVADPGWALVVADAAQLEPRALAGMAGDEALASTGRDGDLYAGLVTSGVVDTRDRAKIGMLSALYGGTAGEAGAILPRLRRAYPRATGLVDRAAEVGERGGTVRTWLGRTSPPPGATWHQVQGRAGEVEASESDERRARSQARDRGRFTRNFVVQGTAAEWALCWMAETRRRLRELAPTARPHIGTTTDLASGEATVGEATVGEATVGEAQVGEAQVGEAQVGEAQVGPTPVPGRGGPHLVFFLHDEIVVHTPADLAPAVEEVLRQAAAAAGKLLFGDFPITFPLHLATVPSYDLADH